MDYTTNLYSGQGKIYFNKAYKRNATRLYALESEYLCYALFNNFLANLIPRYAKLFNFSDVLNKNNEKIVDYERFHPTNKITFGNSYIEKIGDTFIYHNPGESLSIIPKGVDPIYAMMAQAFDKSGSMTNFPTEKSSESPIFIPKRSKFKK